MKPIEKSVEDLNSGDLVRIFLEGNENNFVGYVWGGLREGRILAAFNPKGKVTDSDTIVDPEKYVLWVYKKLLKRDSPPSDTKPIPVLGYEILRRAK